MHFVPPVFMWIYVILNIREFSDESFNFSTSFPLWTVFNLAAQTILVTYWRVIFDPVLIYERPIVDIFFWACFIPYINHIISFALISYLRKKWIERHGVTVLEELINQQCKKQ